MFEVWSCSVGAKLMQLRIWVSASHINFNVRLAESHRGWLSSFSPHCKCTCPTRLRSQEGCREGWSPVLDDILVTSDLAWVSLAFGASKWDNAAYVHCLPSFQVSYAYSWFSLLLLLWLFLLYYYYYILLQPSNLNRNLLETLACVLACARARVYMCTCVIAHLYVTIMVRAGWTDRKTSMYGNLERRSFLEESWCTAVESVPTFTLTHIHATPSLLIAAGASACTLCSPGSYNGSSGAQCAAEGKSGRRECWKNNQTGILGGLIGKTERLIASISAPQTSLLGLVWTFLSVVLCCCSHLYTAGSLTCTPCGAGTYYSSSGTYVGMFTVIYLLVLMILQMIIELWT